MTARLKGLFISVCLVVCLTTLVTSSDISFTASPPTVRPLETKELTLRCGLKDSHVSRDTGHSAVSFVHTLVISKAGVELATVSERLGPNVFDNTTGVDVIGNVIGTGDEKGYLQVSWKFPDSRQGGDYRCDVRGMDQHGHVKTFSKSLYVTVNELSVNDIVGYIHSLTIMNAKQNKTITALKMMGENADMKVKLNDMKTTIADLKTANTNLNALVNKLNSVLQAQVNDLKTKQDTKVIFTAFVDSSLTVSPDEVVVFNIVLTNVGNGYDNSTGVFIPPISGYYVFDLHILGQANKQIKVCIHHNGNCVARAFVDNKYDWQAGSNSISLLLQRGDRVYVVGDKYPSYFHAENITSFSGRLLALE